MTPEEIKQDFESARVKHVHFKIRLRSFLFGNGGAESLIRDPEECSLGQWIALRLRGRGAYAHLPEARLFDRQHILIHEEANRLMDMFQAGQREQAQAGFRPLERIADEMVTLLGTMQARLRTEA